MSLFLLCSRNALTRMLLTAIVTTAGANLCAAQAQSASPDVLVLANGDTIHGKLVNEIGGKVTFHSDALGDLKVDWKDVKELHAGEPFAIINAATPPSSRKMAAKIPVGPVDVENQTMTVHPPNGIAVSPVPVKSAAFLVDQATLNQQVFHHPGFFNGWNGAATAGVTLVQATQSQYTEAGSVGLVRAVPGVSWLTPRNRTSIDFSGSSGRITEPLTPTIKTAIFHADAERDEYFSSRFYVLGMVAFDHNFSQLLDLQSIYGGGVGYTVFREPKQELDVKATLQYEKQQFITPPVPGITTPTRNLIGSTFSASYVLRLRMLTFVQSVAFIPAYNEPSAYSANESNTLSFPAYKNLSFSLGTLNSYLNDPPVSVPPTKANSFQFTMGMTYAIRSKY